MITVEGKGTGISDITYFITNYLCLLCIWMLILLSAHIWFLYFFFPKREWSWHGISLLSYSMCKILVSCTTFILLHLSFTHSSLQFPCSLNLIDMPYICNWCSAIHLQAISCICNQCIHRLFFIHVQTIRSTPFCPFCYLCSSQILLSQT